MCHYVYRKIIPEHEPFFDILKNSLRSYQVNDVTGRMSEITDVIYCCKIWVIAYKTNVSSSGIRVAYISYKRLNVMHFGRLNALVEHVSSIMMAGLCVC